jgi:hypothetical protein
VVKDPTSAASTLALSKISQFHGWTDAGKS